MPVDGNLILAASAAVLALSFGLAARHYRGALRRHIELDNRVREGDARHRVLLDHAPIGCVVWEPGFRIVDWNQQAERIFGWSRAEMVGRHLVEALCREGDAAAMARQAASLFSGYACERDVLRHVARDGREVVCEWRHAAVRDLRGNPVRVVSMCLDMTGLSEIERENALFRSLVEHTVDPAVMLLDGEHESRVLYANAAAVRHFGGGRDDLIGSKPADWSSPGHPEILQRHWQALALGVPVSFETEHADRSGKAIPVEVTANPIKHDGHAYVLCYVRDISARRADEARLRALQISEALLQHEKRYREIFEHSSDALFSVDVLPDGRMSFGNVNPAAEEAFGISAARLSGVSLDRILAGELGRPSSLPLAEHFGAYRSCIETALPAAYEGALNLLPGRQEAAAHYQVTLIPLAGDAGIERIIGIGRDVTAQRRYEAELLRRAELEMRLSRYFDLAPGFFVTIRHRVDGGWEMPFASPGIRSTHGVEPGEATAAMECFVAVADPADLRMLLRCAVKSERNLSLCRVEYRIRHPEKGLRWIECSVQPYRDDDGGTVWHGFMHDVTERRQAMGALAARERLFRSLSENIPDNVGRFSPEGDFVYANPRLLSLLRVENADLIGVRIGQLEGGDFAAFEEAVLQVVATGREVDFELTWTPPGGDLRYDNIRLAPEVDEEGVVVSVLGVGRDITERRQMLSDLAARERLFRTLAEHIPDNVARYAPDGRFLYANPRLLSTLGAKESDLIGLRPSECPFGDFRAYEQAVVKVAATGQETDFELSWMAPDGGMRYHNIRFSLERDEDGAVASVFAVGRDITGRRQIEDTLRFVAQRGWADDAESLLGALARYLGETLALDYVIIDRLTDDPDIAETAALYAKGDIVPNMRYSLAGTPCERVAGRTMCSFRENVQALFPEDALLVQMGVESYAGVPLWDSAGKPIGLIAVLDGKPMADDGPILRILQLVATRAAAELERERAESALRQREQQYRALADNSPDVIIRYDRHCRKLYANTSYRSRFGMSDESFIGQTALETVDIVPPGGQLLHDTVAQVVATGRDTSIELSWREADGHLAICHVRVVPEYGDGEEVVSVLAIARDISALKETERQLIDSRSQLRELAARREDAREDERRRIASDLHEELGQVLTALRMNISMLPLEFGAVLPAIEGRTEEMLRLVDGALQGLRNTVMMLRPTALDAGITAGLEWLTREFGANTGIRCVLHLPPEPLRLADSRATTVFRIAQEALTNIARHAGASRAEIFLEGGRDRWSLAVRDDGQGFDPKLVHDKAFGLRSMSERALSLGGEFDIATAVGQGTTITLRFSR